MKNTSIQDKAFKYYSMGLNSKEIAKLLDKSFRTIQNWIFAGNWKSERKATNLKVESLRLSENGYSYSEIAKRFNVTEQTIYKWIKDVR